MDSEESQRYLKLFSKIYFSQRISEDVIKRIRFYARNSTLVVLSFNKKEVITKLLYSFGILDYFDKVISPKISPNAKAEVMEELKGVYDVQSSEMSFVTDTIRDIKEAISVGITDIYVTVSDIDSETELLKYVPKDHVLEPLHSIEDLKILKEDY